MDNLPIEILNFILIKLDLRQRLECTLVCSRWADQLRKRSLFYSVFIGDETMCKSFLEMIQRFPARALQVEILRLRNAPAVSFDNRKLCNIFPKARIIEITSARNSGQLIHFSKSPVELIVPKAQITRLADYDECELAFELMASERCSRLTYLQICLNAEKDYVLHFIPSIKNLPVLKELVLNGMGVRIADIELIHEDIPTLETFSMEWVTLKASVVPVDIKPASITKLKIDSRGSEEHIDRQLRWLLYIRNKYPALTEFSFWCRGNESYDDGSLQSFYLLGILPIVKKLGSQLTTISPLSVPNGWNLFDYLDEDGAQLKKCKVIVEGRDSVLETIGKSNQAEHIEELSVNYLDKSTFTWLSSIKKLKNLELTYNYISPSDYENEFMSLTRVELNTLLEECPSTLETLVISNANLIFTYPGDTHAQSSVKTLKLDNVVLPKGADKYLALYFPNLRSLHLDKCIFTNGRLSLPSHDLLFLEIITRNKRHLVANMSLKTANMAEPRFYPCRSQGLFADLYDNEYDVYINPTEREMAEYSNEVRLRSLLEIEVASVRSLIVNKLQYSSS